MYSLVKFEICVFTHRILNLTPSEFYMQIHWNSQCKYISVSTYNILNLCIYIYI